MKTWASSLTAILSLLGNSLLTSGATQPYAQAGILKSGDDWEISVVLSDQVDRSTYSLPEHYEISQGELGVVSTVERNGVIVVPATKLLENDSYTFTLKNFQDTNGSNLAPLPINLQTKPVGWTTIGTMELGMESQATAVGERGFELVDGGLQFFGTYDEGNFVYEQVTGDFDRAIRVVEQEPSSRFARAGLMVRETLDGARPRPTNPFDPLQAFSRYLSLHVNPDQTADGRAGNNTHEISYRPYTGGIGSADPDATQFLPIGNNAPPEYPNTWVRIKREGSLFRTFRSVDGKNWIEMENLTFPQTDSNGQAVPSFPETVFVGAVYTPENGNIPATSGLRRSFIAKFRDYQAPGGGNALLMITKGENNQLELHWGGKGVLESTESLGAISWQDTGPVPNPYTFAPTSSRYFRVRK